MFSEYQSSQDELTNIENIAKFNQQFTHYDRDDVQGYELISVVNKVIDYNYRFSNASYGANDNNYSPIELKIVFDSINGNNLDNSFFKKGSYTQSDKNNEIWTEILNKVDSIEERYGNASNASYIAKSISTIFNASTQGEKINAIHKFNSYSSEQKYDEKATHIDDEYDKMRRQEIGWATQYSDYLQFKRAIFKCDTMDYDQATGRVSNIVFIFTGKIH